ncbi:hypothetical protein Tco_0292242 [Tanacetum coccineum]
MVNAIMEPSSLHKSIALQTPSDIQRQPSYKAFSCAYEADKILLDTYGDSVTIKRPRDELQIDDMNPAAGE